MEKYLLPILEDGGPIGAVVVISVLVIGFVLRSKGWLAVDRSKVVSNSQLSALTEEVGSLRQEVGETSRRVGAVERDLLNLPGREEIHQLELAHEKMLGRIGVLEHNTNATKAGVIRIEDFLINLSKGTK